VDPLEVCLTSEVVLFSRTQGKWLCEFHCEGEHFTRHWQTDLLNQLARRAIQLRQLKVKLQRAFNNVEIQHFTFFDSQWLLLRIARQHTYQLSPFSRKSFAVLISQLCEQRHLLEQASQCFEIVASLNEVSCAAILLNVLSGKIICNNKARHYIQHLSNCDAEQWQSELFDTCVSLSELEKIELNVVMGRQIIAMPCDWHGAHSQWKLILVVPDRPTKIMVNYPQLSATEQALCQALIREESPASYAHKNNKSIHTVRAQIQRLYRKLGVNRLNQLRHKLTCHPTGIEP